MSWMCLAGCPCADWAHLLCDRHFHHPDWQQKQDLGDLRALESNGGLCLHRSSRFPIRTVRCHARLDSSSQQSPQENAEVSQLGAL